MSIFLNVLFGGFALAGSWFTFYYLGDKFGEYLTDRHYSFDRIVILTLSDLDRFLRLWDWNEKTEPMTIMNPALWKYFE